MIKMNEETEFKKIAKETLDNIYSRLDGEEKQFLSYLVNCFNISCEKREQLQNNWNELKKWLEEQKDYLTKIDGQHIPLNDSFEFCSMNELYQTGKYSGFMESFEKMKELEQGKDE